MTFLRKDFREKICAAVTIVVSLDNRCQRRASGLPSNTAAMAYRKVAELLRQAGWIVNDKRVERIWQLEGLKVPHKQPKRGRLWLDLGMYPRRPGSARYVPRWSRACRSSSLYSRSAS